MNRTWAMVLACGVFVLILAGLRVGRDRLAPSGLGLLLDRTGAETVDQPVASEVAAYLLEHGQDQAPNPLSTWLDRPVVLNFWATFCEPCRQEWPSLIGLATSRPDVRFLLVSYDEQWDAIHDYLATTAPQGLPDNVVVVRDPGHEIDLKRRLGTDRLPDTYWLKNRQVLTRFVNARSWQDETMVTLFDAVMGPSGR